MRQTAYRAFPAWTRSTVSLLGIILICGLISCEKWKTATISYEAIGEALSTFQSTAQQLCADKKISAETCDKLKTSYNKIRDNYIKAGDLLVDAMKTEDVVTKESILKNYHEIIAQLIVDFGDVQDILKANGVKLDFSKLTKKL